MQPFILNRHDRIVFPSNFVPELDLTVVESLDQLDGVIRRDFESKAPTGMEILEKAEAGGYTSRFELMRDIALSMFWVGRYALTMYEKRPMRWGDVPRQRDDVFMPIVIPWELGDLQMAAVRNMYDSLPPTWDGGVEDHIFEMLVDVFSERRHHAVELNAIKPTVAEILADPTNLTFRLNAFDPDFPMFSLEDIIDCAEDAPELEALHRWAMVLHNQYPWDRSQAELVEVGQLRDDDYVVTLVPRDQQVRHFLRRLQVDAPTTPRPAPPEAKEPTKPYATLDVRATCAVQPKIEALAVVHGDQECSNDDLIRNSAYNWSPMSAEEVSKKTGIEQRLYSSVTLEEMALQAAKAALKKANRGPEEIGAVIVCTCTSTRLIPSVATWISGQLGMQQTHASYDIVAACAGLPYGLADAVRLLQEVERPILVICAEKFSDKIGNVRTSRMIFGDGAAAVVVGVAQEGEVTDIEYLQTFASGPASQVNSIIWPNPEFDNNITVYGPEVKALAGRYLGQMIDQLKTLPAENGEGETLLDSIDLIVPHQANKTMVIGLAANVGLTEDQLYFNISDVGNTSSASIPLAIHDAVRDGVINKPMRVFAPGFGAGAVAGFSVMRIDPSVVAVSPAKSQKRTSSESALRSSVSNEPTDNVEIAFG